MASLRDFSDPKDFVRDLTRRQLEAERRPSIEAASDLLGPGFGPTATQILDWNSDDAAFGGFYWSPIGGINSPDSTVEWVGLSVVEDDNLYGQQAIWSREPVPRYDERAWSDPGGGGTRTYTKWVGDSPWSATGITPFSDCTIAGQMWRTSRGGVVALNVHIIPTRDITFPADGNLSNVDMVQLPTVIVPAAALGDQGLPGAHFGPLTQWTLGNTGVISLAAGPPGITIPAGADLSFGGTFLL